MEFLKSNITPEWEELANEFPEFIFELSPEVKEWREKYYPELEENKFCNLRYGFECNIGWKEIIRNHFRQIKEVLQRAKENGHDVHYKCCILKEKFGELRDQGDFWGDDYSLYREELRDIVITSQEESSKICETCGDSGGLKQRGFWIRTLCQKHALDLGYVDNFY